MGTAKQTKKSNKVLVSVVAIVVALVIVGLATFNVLDSTGIIARNTIVIESENYSVSLAEYSYYFANSYTSLMTQFNYYYQSMGLSSANLINSSKLLKEQACSLDSSMTWFDYFDNMATTEIQRVLALCEAAKAENMTLNDEDMKKVTDAIDEIKASAKSAGVSADDYIKNTYGAYGTTLNLKIVEKILEREALAGKYLQHYVDAVDVSDDALEKIYAENLDKYQVASYMSFTFDITDLLELTEADKPKEDAKDDAADGAKEGTSDDAKDGKNEDSQKIYKDKEEAKAVINNYQTKLMNAGTDDAFMEIIKDFCLNVLYMDEDDFSEDDFIVKNATLNKDDSKSKWVFEDARKVGDMQSFDKEIKDEKNEENNYTEITVLRVTAAKGKNTLPATADVKHILFSKDDYKDDSRVKEVYDKWVADGANLDDFDALAKAYSADKANKENGGLMEDLTVGSTVTEFDNWVFGEPREAGDHAIVHTKDYGWHIIYFVEAGEPQWKQTITTAVQNEAYTNAENAAADKYKSTVDSNKIEKNLNY